VAGKKWQSCQDSREGERRGGEEWRRGGMERKGRK